MFKTLIFYKIDFFTILLRQWLSNYSRPAAEVLLSEAATGFQPPSLPIPSPPPFSPSFLISFLVSLAAGTDTSRFVLARKSLSKQGTRKLLGVRRRSG